MSAALAVEPLSTPPDAVVSVPGSKSLTNRALVCAALAHGDSTITGALIADDTEAMVGCLGRLGVRLTIDGTTIRMQGCGGRIPASDADLDARLSGTTSRFLLPVLGLGHGRFRLDGGDPLRRRPMAPSIEALRSLGASVEEEGEPGHLPVTVVAQGLAGGTLRIAGDESSQFVSGLLLAGPYMADGLRLSLTTDLVAAPFVAMTTAVMRAFGAEVEALAVAPATYRAHDYPVEPDASAASYFLAAAALAGGRVTVAGLGGPSLQGDAAFADVLARMGAVVERGPHGLTVTGSGQLHGIDVDLGDQPDMAQTVAATAVFATGATRVRGVGVIRRHETDRVRAVVTELRRCGIEAEETGDGFVVHPGTPRPATIETYHDHRMAMSFALLGLRAPGIRIAEPEVVGKTFPGFWRALDGLRRQ